MSILASITLVYVLGTLMGLFLPVPIPAAGAAVVAGCGLVLFCLATKKLVFVSLMIVFFVFGWSRPSPKSENHGAVNTAPCTRIVEGRVTSPAIQIKDHQQIEIDMRRWSQCLSTPRIGPLKPTTGTLYLWVTDPRKMTVHRGEEIRVRGRVKAIVPRQNPGSPSISHRRHAYVATVNTSDAIALTRVPKINWRQGFDSARGRFADFFDQHLSKSGAGLARALSLGESQVLNHQQRDWFRRTGTAHLLSVSGLHLGLGVFFVLLLLEGVLRRTPLAHRWDVGRIAAFSAIPVALVFTLLTGCRIPVVRACIMVISALLSRAFWKNRGVVEAVALAAIIIVVHDPNALLEIGFQLSFVAVIGFLITYDRGRSKETVTQSSALLRGSSPVSPLNKGMSWFAQTATATTVAFAVTSPVVLYHFGYLPLLAVPANLIAVPLTGLVIMPLLFIILATATTVPGIAAFLTSPLDMVLELLSRFLAALSHLPCTVENPGPLLSVGITLVCCSAIFFFRRRPRWGFPILALSVPLFISSPFADPKSFEEGQLTVDFLDVGQGDATLVTFPSGEHLLVDAGGTHGGKYDVGANVVIPALRALGVKRLDMVALTHPDFDHMGGLPAVLEKIDVGELWENGKGETSKDGAVYKRIQQLVRTRRIPVRYPNSLCRTHVIGECTLSVIHPCDKDIDEEYDSSYDSSNDSSLVIVVRYKEVAIALTGDISASVEEELVAKGVVPKVDILKLGHHGSRSSSSHIFLKQAAPHYAVASAGPFNRHKMPHVSVLRRLAQQGISLFRTDRQGAVRAITDGRGISIRIQKQ